MHLFFSCTQFNSKNIHASACCLRYYIDHINFISDNIKTFTRKIFLNSVLHARYEFGLSGERPLNRIQLYIERNTNHWHSRLAAGVQSADSISCYDHLLIS